MARLVGRIAFLEELAGTIQANEAEDPDVRHARAIQKFNDILADLVASGRVKETPEGLKMDAEASFTPHERGIACLAVVMDQEAVLGAALGGANEPPAAS